MDSTFGNCIVFFAANGNNSHDGALWILGCKEELNDRPINISPFEIQKPKVICKEFDILPKEKYIKEMPLGRLRRFMQNGFFSIIPQAYLSATFESIIDDNFFLRKYTIPPEVKASINRDISPCVRAMLYCEGKCSDGEHRLLDFMETLNKKLKPNKTI